MVEWFYVDMEGVIFIVVVVVLVVGVVKGIFYLYFKMKEEIFFGLLEWCYLVWFEDIEF